jgi:hypothetical protein
MDGKKLGQVVIDGVDVIDLITWINKKNKKYLANGMDDVEKVLGKDSEEFIKVRKIFLDSFNDYTRSILVSLFGNIEGIFNDFRR